MTIQPNDLPAKLIEVAEELESKARIVAIKARRKTKAWKPVGYFDPSELLERVEGLVQSLKADEIGGVVSRIGAMVPNERQRLRVLGTLLRLVSDEITAVLTEVIADQRDDAIKAASLNVLFVPDLRCLRVAILSVREIMVPFDGGARAAALRCLLSGAGQPDEPAESEYVFEDLARLSLHSMQILLGAFKGNTMAVAMVGAPVSVAEPVAAGQTRVGRRIFDEAVDIARLRASADDILSARWLVLEWFTKELRVGNIVFEPPSRLPREGGGDGQGG